MLIHLVNRTVADVRRALWWQERTARHRYMLKLAVENERQRMQAQIASKRCADTDETDPPAISECIASSSLQVRQQRVFCRRHLAGLLCYLLDV